MTPGEEVQWDWVELGSAPWGGDALLLVGSLPFSGRFRAVLAEAMDQPHLIEALDGVLRRLGGTARAWRVDRMATVINSDTGRLQASFAPVAKHYGVAVVACPPRRGNRKGSVEKSIHYATQRWWRTLAATTMVDAQADLDRWCTRVADRRRRPKARLERLGSPADHRPMVGELADAERLGALPDLAYPATVTVERQVDAQALVAFRGNRYSVPPGLVRHSVHVRWRLGATTLDIVSEAGTVATHRLAVPGAAEALAEHLEDGQDLSHVEFLERLLRVEVDATAARRHASMLRFACFPAPWRIEDFDFDAQPAVDRKLVASSGPQATGLTLAS